MFVHHLKLQPPQMQPIWLPRPRLEHAIGADVRVLSIVAGPGYGKTVLATRIYGAATRPRSWYSFDAADVDLAVFATHVATMTRSYETHPSSPDDAWQLRTAKDVGGRFAEAIAGLVEKPIVIFDDVHLLRGGPALAALEELVQRGVRAGASFVLCGRSMPLPLHRFAASSQLASLAAADLAFDEGEARAFLSNVMRRRQEQGEVATLINRAEGWPAGLALIASTAISLARQHSEGGSVSSDDARQLLFEYLAAEALDDLSEVERNFLLRTAVLDRLDVALCSALVERDDAPEILKSLATKGLFVERRSDDMFICHQLFREFLMHTLEQSTQPELVRSLRRHASELFAARGEWISAVAQRIDAGELDAAADLLDLHVPGLLNSGRISAVAGLLERVGLGRAASRAGLLMAHGRVMRERGDWDAALATLERAILCAERTGAVEVLAEAVRISASIRASRGEFEPVRLMIEDALALGDALSEQSATSLRITLAAICIETERFEDALAIFREVTPLVMARADDAALGSVLHNSAVANLRRGEPYAGLTLYQRALTLKQNHGQRVSSLLTLGDLVYTRMLLGDVDEAETLCASLLSEAQKYGSSTAIAHAHERRGMLRLMRGDDRAANRAFIEARSSCDPGDVLLMPDILHGLAQCALARNALADADELCATAIASFRAARKCQQMATILVTRGRILAQQGDTAGAIATAAEAIENSADGADAVLETTTRLDAAALLKKTLPELGTAEGLYADRLASDAATKAIAVLHQRDYRFLLRTKATTFAALAEHLRRWNIGGALLRDVSARKSGLRVEMLGGFEVLIDDRPVGQGIWKRRRARDILAYLVSSRGRPVPRSRLAELYWPDLDADAANDNLRVTISAVRKAVGDVVKFEGDGYRFVCPPGTFIDRDAFGEQIERAREAVTRGDAIASRVHYKAAIEMYRGDFLDGMDDGGWQWHERERLRATCLEALRAVSLDPDAVASRLALERLLQLAPFDLDAMRKRLELLVAELRLPDARRAYAEWQTHYRAAVGADPPDIWTVPDRE